MSIPKTLHYCWFGGNPKPEKVLTCIESWKKFCPDYKIIEWNEQNYDCSRALYTKQALERKQWAFVTDYARLEILYQHGGIYVDTDVELIRPLDDLLQYDAFFGFQNNNQVASGLGCGARKGHPLLLELLKDYDRPFIMENGMEDHGNCPGRNTETLVRLGLRADGTRQTLADAEFFPVDSFCPMNFTTGKLTITPNTYSIHHFHSSAMSKMERFDATVVERLLGPTLFHKVYRPVRRWLGMQRLKLALKFKS